MSLYFWHIVHVCEHVTRFYKTLFYKASKILNANFPTHSNDILEALHAVCIIDWAYHRLLVIFSFAESKFKAPTVHHLGDPSCIQPSEETYSEGVSWPGL